MSSKFTECKNNIHECRMWAQSRIQHIENDSRFQDDLASVFINMSLALIQADMKAELRALRAVLKILEGKT